MPEGTNDVLGSTKAGSGPAFVGRKGTRIACIRCGSGIASLLFLRGKSDESEDIETFDEAVASWLLNTELLFP